MRKTLSIAVVILLLNMGLVFAHEHDFRETKQLIDSGISCDKLTDEQFEAMGDYYMEQMHSGEAHEVMDKMMGGEGSDSLKQMHIQIAKRLYCNETASGMMGGGMMGSGGMMNMMGGSDMMSMMMGNNMMGSGGMMGSGMMQNSGYSYNYWSFINLLYIILLIGLIIIVYLWILKLWKGMQNSKSIKK